MKKQEIKLIDLWYLDGNYNKPVKTQGFKSLIKKDLYNDEKQGYVFIDPKTKAFMLSKDKETIFEREEDANYYLNKQIKSHIEYIERQIKEYTEELKRCSSL